jgi:hypothetical protein
VPEVRFYLLSPAAELLRAAEETLPILRLGDAEDPKPLMQPAANDQVPWQEGEASEMEGDPIWAFAFLIAALVPTGVLLHLSRRPNGRARAKGRS